LFGLEDLTHVLGKTDADLFTPEHGQSALHDEQEIRRTGQPLVNMEEKETWPDGRETWVSTTKLPLRDPGGQIIGTFGLSRDITEKKRAEEELALLARELREKNETLEQDLEVARELQQAMLPHRYPRLPDHSLKGESNRLGGVTETLGKAELHIEGQLVMLEKAVLKWCPRFTAHSESSKHSG
jgi:PAS domain S-box-containing protein